MSNEIKSFAFEGRSIRTTQDDQGNPLWVAKDVTEALGYTWKTNLVYGVPDEWRGTKLISTLGGAQEMSVLTEQGLYFFLGRSDKSAALPFQKWIAGEVLPSIRKTGKYETPKATTPAIPETIPQALRVIADLVEENIDLKDQIARLPPPPQPEDMPIHAKGRSLSWEVTRWLTPANLRVTMDGSAYEVTTREILERAMGFDRYQVFGEDQAMVARILRNLGWARDGRTFILPIKSTTLQLR